MANFNSHVDVSSQLLVQAALLLTETAEKFDSSTGGRAAAARPGRSRPHGISRALLDYNGELRERLKSAGFLTARSAQEGTQEVRSDGRRARFQFSKRLERKRRRPWSEVTHEGDARSRCPLRAPDPALEPEDEALHLRQAQRDLHHRPAEDAADVQPGREFVQQLAAEGKRILFVGTKRQAQEAIAEEASRCGEFYVTNRWLGGSADQLRHPAHLDQRLKEIEARLSTRTAR
jgi:ribosomal protein S9